MVQEGCLTVEASYLDEDLHPVYFGFKLSHLFS